MSAYKYFTVINAMKTKADKFDLRLRMVRYAINDGIKPAARAFAATPRARIVTGTAKLAVVHETQNYSTSTAL